MVGDDVVGDWEGDAVVSGAALGVTVVGDPVGALVVGLALGTRVNGAIEGLTVVGLTLVGAIVRKAPAPTYRTC
jgi:hypothetical protein